MTSLPDVDPALCVEPGHGSVLGQGKGTFCKDKIKLCQNGIICAYGICVFCRVGAQASQDNLDFFLLFGVQFL